MEISVQTGGLIETYGAEKTAKFIKEAGFTALDWGINRGWDRAAISSGKGLPHGCIYDKSMEDIINYWQADFDAYKGQGLSFVQTHAPFPAYVDYDPNFIDYAIEVYKKCIRYCDYIGCPQLIVHGITLGSDDVDALNLKLYTSLIPTLKETNVTVCLENLFDRKLEGHCTDPVKAAEFIDFLNEKAGKECFGLCLDTGHLNLLHVDVTQFILTLGKRIKALHINDNDGLSDQHMAPYAGSFPWKEFLVALKEVGYEGSLNFETFGQVSATRIPEAMVPEFLRHICSIGEYFKTELQK